MSDKNKEMAAILAKVEKFFDEGGEFETVRARIKAIESSVEELNGVDVKSAIEEFDKLKAAQETIVQQIKDHRPASHVPGIEDEDFSLLRTIVAIKSGGDEAAFNKAGASKEKAILDEVREKASHAVGDDVLGGYFVPDQVIPDVIGAIYTTSVFIGLEGDETNQQTRVSVLSGLTGGNVKVPKFDGGMIAFWIGEEDEYAESAAQVGDMTMNPKKLGILMRMTDSMRRLQGYGFEALLRRDMVQAAAKKLDWTIAFGRGTDHTPLGIARQPGIKVFQAETGTCFDLSTATGLAAFQAVADWDGGELDFDGLDNMELCLEEDDIALDSTHLWVSSPRWIKRLKQLKVDNYSGQTANRPYLLGIPMIPRNRLAEIIGPFATSTQIASDDLPGASVDGATDSTNQKYTTVFGGNLGNVVIGRWGGIEIEDDGGKGKGFVSDHTYVKLRLYADVGVRQPRSLIVCPDALARN